MATRTQIQVKGIVQGVGFRPFVHSLAKKNGLNGRVLNNGSGVTIDVEGERVAIDQFATALTLHAPPLSVIDSIVRKDSLPIESYPDFEILESKTNGTKFVPVSADIATCDDCLAEMLDPTDRRYRYPFINCTNCGPRFTIIEDVPYDRQRTTMSAFPMCDDCRAEYEDPSNRRFHAEPIVCPICGPRLTLLDRKGDVENDKDPLETAKGKIRNGSVVAVKGLGGYHLVCDAMNADAVNALRSRKYREDKPFALMADSVERIREYCEISEEEMSLLISRERPIVLLNKKPDCAIPNSVAPSVKTLGFMLPYTPLHYLLTTGMHTPLVMTSGNISDEPIYYRDHDAIEKLEGIADYYLVHDRPINIRTDDSVARVRKSGRAMVLRRSRGYAPAPLKMASKFENQVLACGAELKNTFCLTKGDYAFISHHIGDLENLETLDSFVEGIDHFKRLFNLSPEVIAYDLHPEYLSTKYAHSCEEINTKVGVQHHHAHIASCLADNETEGEVIGVAMDGLGFGLDGKIWGGEFFVADCCDAIRVGHLANVPMPGGSKAIKEPWRMAAAYLNAAFGDELTDLDIEFSRKLDRKKWSTIRSMIGSETNSPMTSSMGRLFDAVSAILGLRSEVNYEGQAAIALEAISTEVGTSHYQFHIGPDGMIDGIGVIRSVVDDLISGTNVGVIAGRFHLAVAELIADMAVTVRDRYRLDRVALSGGVFQNMVLLEKSSELLASRGFEVLTHSRVPTNDGGISLGQAVIAEQRINRRRT